MKGEMQHVQIDEFTSESIICPYCGDVDTDPRDCPHEYLEPEYMNQCFEWALSSCTECGKEFQTKVILMYWSKKGTDLIKTD